MTWGIYVWSLFWLILILGPITDSPAKEHCKGDQTCADLTNLSRGFAAVVFVIIWLLGFLSLLFAAFMTRPQRRVCPGCGVVVRPRRTCKKCGHDFRAWRGDQVA
jgi:hypothetical protein